MSRRDYPRVEAKPQPRWKQLAASGKTGPTCSAIDCKHPATHRVDIEVSWFRGEDEVGRACDMHINDAHALLEGIHAKPAHSITARDAS